MARIPEHDGTGNPGGGSGKPITRTGRTVKVQPPSSRHRRMREGAARFREEAKRELWTDSLTPVPRSKGAALSMGCDGRPKRSAGQAAPRPDDGRSAPNRTRASEAKHMNETQRKIEAAMTENGGWTKATLTGWGVKWPPKPGWKREMIDNDVLKEPCA